MRAGRNSNLIDAISAPASADGKYIQIEIEWLSQQLRLRAMTARIEQDKAGEEDEDEDGEQVIPLISYLAGLSPELKAQFRVTHPEIPELFFMSAKEKLGYFKKINKDFVKRMAKAPQRHSRSASTVRFKDMFEVKPFSEKERVQAVSKTPAFKDTYQPEIHFG